jgi:hypothetical protein
MSRDEVKSVLLARNPSVIMYDNWRAIDRAERMAGRSSGRPRVKLAQLDSLLETAFMPQTANSTRTEVKASGVS